MKIDNKIQDNAQSLQAVVSVSVTDLRIGNLIHYNGNNKSVGKISLLVSDLIGALDYCQLDYRRNKKHWLINLDPIPITEEWLLNFGFVKYGKFHDSYKLNPFIVELGILGNHYTFRKIMNEAESILLKEMKYVHELQNIYKELKGSELQEVSLTEH